LGKKKHHEKYSLTKGKGTEIGKNLKEVREITNKASKRPLSQSVYNATSKKPIETKGKNGRSKGRILGRLPLKKR